MQRVFRARAAGRRLDPPLCACQSARVLLERLIHAGFARAGVFDDRGDGLDLFDAADLSIEAVVYAFAQELDVLYVGASAGPLSARVARVLRPGRLNAADRRLRAQISGAVKRGGAVDLYAAAPGWGEWNGLPVALYLGLEHALVDRIGPPWNSGAA